jgi:nucleoside-diphosphate-sugar epimerase
MKSLLFTGASGFLGYNINLLLSKSFDVVTMGLADIDNYKVNLVDEVPVLNERYNVVLHAAGKAHSVPTSDSEIKSFFDVNLQGTINLCNALEQSGVPQSFVFISSVAVYGVDFGVNITEENPLNGTTPYALSKIQAEKFLTEWCARFSVILSIIRPSLIAGPNPPGNLGAMISGIKSGRYLSVSGGKARKSVLMVRDIANLVPLLVERGGIYNVCDSEHPTFRDLEKTIAIQLGKPLPLSIPYKLAKMMSLVGDLFGSKAPVNSNKLNKITRSLTFSNKKAVKELGWKPMNVLRNFRI